MDPSDTVASSRSLNEILRSSFHPSSLQGFSGDSITQLLEVFWVVFCGLLFGVQCFYFWPLNQTLLNKGFQMVKLKSSLRKIYGRHQDLVNSYGISVSQMTTDMFSFSLSQLTTDMFSFSLSQLTTDIFSFHYHN